MKTTTMFAIALATLTTTGLARAEHKTSPEAAAARADIQKTFGFQPQFLLRFPDAALPGAWDEMKSLQLNPSTALSGKQKELVGLAVAAQVPCRFCVIAHTEFAKLNGASDAEIKEAIGMASVTRNLSTMLNGMQVDETQFRKDVDRLVKNVTSKKERASR